MSQSLRMRKRSRIRKSHEISENRQPVASPSAAPSKPSSTSHPPPLRLGRASLLPRPAARPGGWASIHRRGPSPTPRHEEQCSLVRGTFRARPTLPSSRHTSVRRASPPRADRRHASAATARPAFAPCPRPTAARPGTGRPRAAAWRPGPRRTQRSIRDRCRLWTNGGRVVFQPPARVCATGIPVPSHEFLLGQLLGQRVVGVDGREVVRGRV